MHAIIVHIFFFNQRKLAKPPKAFQIPSYFAAVLFQSLQLPYPFIFRYKYDITDKIPLHLLFSPLHITFAHTVHTYNPTTAWYGRKIAIYYYLLNTILPQLEAHSRSGKEIYMYNLQIVPLLSQYSEESQQEIYLVVSDQKNSVETTFVQFRHQLSCTRVLHNLWSPITCKILGSINKAKWIESCKTYPSITSSFITVPPIIDDVYSARLELLHAHRYHSLPIGLSKIFSRYRLMYICVPIQYSSTILFPNCTLEKNVARALS